MKIKEGCKASTSEFWYDINEGYLKPEDILEDSKDVEAVYDALVVLKEFEESCEEQIEGFIQ